MAKRICFIITDAVSFNVLCRGQLEFIRDNSDFDVTLICGGDKVQLDKLSEREVGKVINANFKRNPSLLKDTKSLIFLLKYLAFNRFDIIVYSTPKALLLGSIASYATLHKNRTAIIRGRVYENFFGKKRRFFHILDKLSLLMSNKVVFISESLKKAYLNDGLINESKAILLGEGSSNGVDTISFNPANSTNSKQKNNYNAEFIVLIIGRICHDKGIYDLAEIIDKSKHQNIKFLLIGKIEDERSEILLQNIIESHSNVEHINYTENVIKYFQNADLHLFLSHREGFGNVAIEAASCGVPTFAYDVVGIKDSVSEGISGKKFVFKDTQSIAKEIDKAASNPNFKLEYKSARDWSIEHFDQKKVWRNYLDFYSKNV